MSNDLDVHDVDTWLLSYMHPKPMVENGGVERPVDAGLRILQVKGKNEKRGPGKSNLYVVV